MRFGILLLALLIDRVVGDPDWLWRRFPHPVAWFGGLIDYSDEHFNREEASPRNRVLSGVISLSVLIILVATAGATLSWLLALAGWFGLLFEAIIVSVFLAQKSLLDHVRAVIAGLREGGLVDGRKAVSKIVGRDPQTLDKPGICRAAIESLAENFSDGVVAPMFWYLLGGLPGLLVYKLVNTADSMIGHMNDRHRDFGRAAAQLDDVLNWPAARLSAGLIGLATAILLGKKTGQSVLVTVLRDAGLHRSPNAGWPEAAMAGGLGLALGGPRSYGEAQVNAACLNGAGRRNADVRDVGAAIEITSTSYGLLAVIAATGFVFFLIIS